MKYLRRLPPSILVLSLVSGLCGAAALAQAQPTAARPELVPVPVPNLDGVEPQATEQLRSLRGEVESLAAQTEAPRTDLADAYGTLGQVYLGYELVEPALGCFTNASRLAPGDYRWPYYLGVLAQEKRQTDAAISHFQAALELRNEDLPSRIRQAQVALLAQQIDVAEEAFRQLVDTPSAAAVAHYGLGEIAMQRGRHAIAVQHFEATIAAQPNASAAQYQLGLALRELGETERAKQYLSKYGFVPVAFEDPLMEQLSTLAAGSGAHIVRASAARAAGSFEQAAKEYRLALAADPDHIDARQALASTLLQLGDLESAIAEIETVIEREPENAAAQYNLGTLLAASGRVDEAIDHLRRAADLAPGFADARVNLAMALEREERIAEAEKAYAQALEINPENVDTWRRRAALRSKLGRQEEAIADLREALQRRPDDPETLLGLGVVLAKTDQKDDALSLLWQVVDSSSVPQQRALAQRTIAQVAAEQGDLRTAIASLQEAVALQPDLVEAHADLANLLAELGRYAEAADEFAVVVEAQPDNQPARFGHALTLMMSKQYPEAATSLESSVSAFPDNATLKHVLARLLATCPEDSIRDGERALQLAGEAMQTRPGFEQAQTLAMALAEVGRFEEAAELQRQLIQSAKDAGQEAVLPMLQAQLSSYEQGTPVRAPWLGGS